MLTKGGRGINYENTYLVMLLSAVINNKKIAVPRKRFQWQEILKLAEFHHVINPVYYGILGLEKKVSEEEAEKFYMKYRRELLTGAAYKNAREVIEWQLKRHGINGFLLRGTESRKLYFQWELGYTSALEILVDEEDLDRIHTMMVSMDYELEENREIRGKVYTRVPGIKVIFFDEVPVGNKVLYKHLTEHAKRYFYLQKKDWFFTMELPMRYLYYVGKLADAYMLGELKIRDILDYYLLIRQDRMKEVLKSTVDIVEKAGLAEFLKQVGILAKLWFGDGRNDDPSRAFMLEEYIFSKGMEKRILDSAIIPYEKTRLDFYQRDREEEWGQRRMEWFLPSQEYMSQIFPILNRFPYLIGICWGIRGIRFFRKSMAEYRKRLSCRIKSCIFRLKFKIINKIHKGRNETSDHEKHEDK